ncbi:MAG: hypothetical protein FWF34_00610 [Alphaproteobacteria bacterium]|nr:hypothetical protein [Alphaproteobacteria bacterium]MCL2889748.1 hypothetical protein [Alphaproteobacteria bacterium]
MFKRALLFSLFAVIFAPMVASAAAVCHVPNLIQCLDSACAANIETNPGARCIACASRELADLARGAVTNEYNFGRPAAQMQSLALGRAASNVLTDAQLRELPTDPGARYAAARKLCFEKIAGCGDTDAERNYDTLINKSCEAVITADELARVMVAKPQKTERACESDINLCLVADAGCGADWAGCAENNDFNRVFAACVVEKDCGHLAVDTLRTASIATRDNYFAARTTNIENVAAARRDARDRRLAGARADCASGATKNACIAEVCSYMPNRCGNDFAHERGHATNFCKYIDLACERIKQ